jgi:hypothetical protein
LFNRSSKNVNSDYDDSDSDVSEDDKILANLPQPLDHLALTPNNEKYEHVDHDDDDDIENHGTSLWEKFQKKAEQKISEQPIPEESNLESLFDGDESDDNINGTMAGGDLNLLSEL